MNARVTAAQIQALVASRVESDAADAVLEIFKRDQGKPLTKRLLGKLPGGEDVWCITHVAGMTHVETREYRRTQGQKGICLLVAYDTKNVAMDAKFLEERNPAYFSARKERNEKRADVSEASCAALAEAINRVIAAREALAEAEAGFDALAGYGKPFDADRYELEALAKGEEST